MDAQQVIVWFKKHARSFPWRTEERNPYAVWVSEIMLQQTRASVVIPYFQKWMERFPTVRDLAQAKISDVIKQWEGLGYYSRARNLHTGAKYIEEHYQGKIPHEEQELKKIKGLGPYTIGAILAFAFKQRTAAIDGNAVRVLSRFHGIEEDITKSSTIKHIRQLAKENTPLIEPWIFTEALIEIGATVCTRKPQCAQCPLQWQCIAAKNHMTDVIPNKPKKQPQIPIHRAVAVIVDAEEVLVKKSEKGLMQDLYEFPYLECELADPVGKIISWIEERIHMPISLIGQLQQVTHTFTKYRALLSPFLFRRVCKKSESKDKARTIANKDDMTDCANSYEQNFEWIPWKKIFFLPFSSGHRRIAQQLKELL